MTSLDAAILIFFIFISDTECPSANTCGHSSVVCPMDVAGEAILFTTPAQTTSE